MKTETLFASLLLFLSTCLPVALAVGYPVLDKKPPPGESGVHYDKASNAVHTYYGDKDLPQHMEHLMYNQRKHPENNRPFKVNPPGSTSNRQSALAGVKPVKGLVRDEKPPNSMAHDGKKVTVRYLPKDESMREMKLLSTTTSKARSAKAEVHLHANPSTNYNGRGAKSLSRPGSPTPGPTRQRASSAPPPLRGKSPGRTASPGSARSGSVDRGSRTPSPKPAWNAGPGKQPKSPSSRAGSPNQSPGRTPSPKPASNAGPGRQRAGSAPPPSRGRPLTRTTTPTGSRSSRPVQNAGARGRSPARNATPGPSRQRNATPGPSQPKKVATPNKPKPAWNAGPGARAKSPSPPAAGPRRSSRLAAPKPPTKPPTKPPSGKKK